jgi:hypothetical protein
MLQIKKDRNTLAELKDNLTVTKVAVDGKQKLLAQLEDKNQELAVQESLLQLRLQQSKNQMLKHTNQVGTVMQILDLIGFFLIVITIKSYLCL